MIPPFLIKPLIYLAVLASVASVSFYKGFSYAETTYKAAQTVQAEQNAKKLFEAINKTEKDTKRHYERYIATLKNVNKLPDTCHLSNDFRRLHDAATNNLPEKPTEGTVEVRTLAATLAANYANCEQNAIWLRECNSICK